MPAPNIRSTTQEHLSIEDITHNLILLKDGSAAMAVKVSAINFNLLSEQEQDAIIYSYAGLLNSLSFPIQILIRSQRKDISNYIRLLKSQEARELNPIIKARITSYRGFIEKIVKERNVLDKTFYVIIPFPSTELGVSQGMNPLAKKPQKLPYDKNYIIQKALSSLEPKRDHLLRQFAHLNLNPKQLTTQELIQLFYNVYNPDSHEGVTLATPRQYQQSMVQTPTSTPPATEMTANPPSPTPIPNQAGSSDTSQAPQPTATTPTSPPPTTDPATTQTPTNSQNPPPATPAPPTPAQPSYTTPTPPSQNS